MKLRVIDGKIKCDWESFSEHNCYQEMLHQCWAIILGWAEPVEL